MDIKAMQAATRAAVRKRFGRKRYLESRALPHFPVSVEREYIRVVNGYMGLLNGLIATGIPAIRSLFGGVRMDAAGPQDERVEGVPSAAEVAAFNHEMDRMFSDLQKEFDYGQGLFDLQDRVKRMANIGRKLSIAEWKRMVKRTLGIDIMDDYYRGAQFEQMTERWVADNVGLIETIPQDTLGKMRDVVKAGFASGASGKTIAAQIREAYDVSKYRARFLARDQSAKLNAQITRQQQEDAGVSEYVWRTTGDSRVRESHGHLNGKRFKYSDPPIVDTSTGRRENPGGDFQCRCVALPVFDIDSIVLPWGVSGAPTPTGVPGVALQGLTNGGDTSNISLGGGMSGGDGQPWVEIDKNDDIARAIGTRRGVSMDVQDALDGTNPNYALKAGYADNCQRCVPAYELRRRGYDVQAKPKPTTGTDSILSNANGFTVFVDKQGNAMKYKQPGRADLIRQMEKYPDGARFAVRCNWKKSGRHDPGHVFIAEKDNGLVEFYDPQNPSEDASTYIGKGRMFGFMRIDDVAFNPDIDLNDVVEVV